MSTCVTDLTGQRFGRLLVVGYKHSRYWNCLCDCGNIKTVRADALKEGKTKSCGCISKNDLTGKTFGRLQVLSPHEKVKNKTTIWLCKCSCGVIKTVRGSDMVQGKTQSCGCLALENRTSNGGLSGTGIYNSWKSMLNRCENKNDPAYRNYGARGITVCDRWHDTSLFVEDMGPRPEGTSIDRIDNDGNYEMSNCRWADNYQQNSNRRNSRKIAS
jgi:hypothetical protein